jgi:hypothetical protein
MKTSPEEWSLALSRHFKYVLLVKFRKEVKHWNCCATQRVNKFSHTNIKFVQGYLYYQAKEGETHCCAYVES